jgi:hypothetical protein
MKAALGIHVVWSGTRAKRRELCRHRSRDLFQIGLRRLRQRRYGSEQSQQAENKYRCNSTLHVKAVNVGDQVEAGQALAKLDSEDELNAL